MTLYVIEAQYCEGGGVVAEAGLFRTQEAAEAKAAQMQAAHEIPGYLIYPIELSDATIPNGIWDGGFDELGRNADPATSRYRTRLTEIDDLPEAHRWTEADPDHQEVRGNFWTSQKGCQSRLLYDRHVPAFFFRLEHVVRVHIQFPPEEYVKRHGLDIRQALESGMGWLGSVLATTGARELVFDSTSRLLRRFVTGKLGFTAAPETLKRPLAPPPSEAPN